MKTKYLLLLVVGIFCSMSIKAIEKNIPICSYSDFEEEWGKDRRSITLEPIAAIDGNTIHIYTDIAVSSVTVVVKDQCGNAVYYNGDGTSSQCHTFGMYDLQDGDYLLEFKIGDESYYGYFSIQQ
ncbi:DUF3244 domain-containing protein [Bacteroides helcogenes]|uniref:DUF3244 domain-containing protein n=1 Tax=Bacteroides helcogenes (strain ATCC 35417 / DSM 20613 / JCM 6297 / CCUG 15421 / P 36-108) TaxID=693979 RepID=E6STE4_BACT6|nr:DUF3244 domain-containing protein [Bacteroides helcogenes]ADV43218.1 hypothetical protein Bache_1208 [Bacteroides helcogenes P 36-108]MDY5239193.1 DUF3244 domain-containing protein [Bacteroides helcogenes]